MKKNTILIVIFVSVLLISLVGVIYWAFFIGPKNIMIEKDRKSWSIENQQQLASTAVEAYLKQEKTESMISRKNRLKTYFTPNSTFFLEMSLLGEIAQKSTAKVVSVELCEEQEGGNLCLAVDTQIVITATDGSTEDLSQQYLVAIEKTPENIFLVTTIVPWNF